MKNEIGEAIRKLERGDIARDDLPRMVVRIANDLGELVRLSGALLAGFLDGPSITGSIGTLRSGRNDSGSKGEPDRIALRVAEVASMLAISRSALYEMIYKREIGVVRFGNRFLRIPRSEIGRLLTDNLIPRLIR